VKLKKIKLQGPSIARTPSKALRWVLNKYSLSYLILYFFLKRAPKIAYASGPSIPESAPAYSHVKKAMVALHLLR